MGRILHQKLFVRFGDSNELNVRVVQRCLKETIHVPVDEPYRTDTKRCALRRLRGRCLGKSPWQ